MPSRESPRGPRHALARGPRVFLRRPAAADEEEFLRIRRESAHLHRPWEPAPARDSDPYGSEAFAQFLRSGRRRDRSRYLVCLREGGAIAGNVNLSQIFYGALCSGCLGYWAAQEHTGRGYMTEGLQLVLAHAFEELGLHRVEANVQPENERSLALVRRCGFRREGYSPRYLHIAGAWRDHERWALLVEDWRRARAGD